MNHIIPPTVQVDDQRNVLGRCSRIPLPFWCCNPPARRDLVVGVPRLAARLVAGRPFHGRLQTPEHSSMLPKQQPAQLLRRRTVPRSSGGCSASVICRAVMVQIGLWFGWPSSPFRRTTGLEGKGRKKKKKKKKKKREKKGQTFRRVAMDRKENGGEQAAIEEQERAAKASERERARVKTRKREERKERKEKKGHGTAACAV